MRQHILVVEDEKHLGVGIKYNLEAENYRVTLVEDGATALRMVNNNGESIDLIVLDLMLPGLSGYTVCETIRDAGVTTPVLMLSARTLAEDRTRGFDVGANQYMSKPFELDELLSRIKNLLQIGRSKTTPTKPAKIPNAIVELDFGNVRVNFETHEATVSDQAVRMTPKELKLLKYFAEHKDRVISRNELLSEVWDLPGNIQTRAVDQFIARLRKIIEPDTTTPVHLLTIRDAGYRFIQHPANSSTEENLEENIKQEHADHNEGNNQHAEGSSECDQEGEADPLKEP
ncbi:MAG TPA: DNA-binding response regulator [Rhodopirellula sp.]|nr:MAG: DNA-binding response regulator [Saprospirales bacterium TMED214]HBV65091.1 DNA-binding response regulator [Rhodopirellula sp.]